MRFFDYLLFMFLGALAGAAGYHFFVVGQNLEKRDPMPQAKQQILLERIKEVAKLVTVEGEFSNVHEYNNFYAYDISPLRKKALVKVKAKVAVGYDLSQLNWEVDEINKIVRVRNLPDPQILSIDHDLEYYDIQEGVFNAFNEEELTSINVVVKKMLREEAQESELMAKARREGLRNLGLIKLLVEQNGWTFEAVRSAPKNIEDQQKAAPSADSLIRIKIPPLSEKKATQGLE
ncbi:DUF4230 domain-containing protein [Saprospira sp. CCB-QB6]|uniref:DUF4230 domain-containing protein n=1 Tax=Saprospira sp. CCB-QB6 TaxID=3023936 RepID=UPI00234A54F9|nr:DUF4230 domain-containing protein [Saprospira sp. CCB-QB6]WCL80947.1 DUF4230 domain-containing protein [Saprospira sp. CCB-QB6]